jgi:hypothetical protein
MRDPNLNQLAYAPSADILHTSDIHLFNSGRRHHGSEWAAQRISNVIW